jgi:inward rectifier potassium channel
MTSADARFRQCKPGARWLYSPPMARTTGKYGLSGPGPQLDHAPGPFTDMYHYLLTASWPMLLLIIATVFFGANLLFALGYYLDGGIENVHSGSYLDMFFFSVQTMATIGYGKLEPVSLLSNILVSFEAFVGLLALAMMTGLVFAKFSRPTARVRFTRYAVISKRDGVPSLMVRMANMRANRIVEADVHLTVVWDEQTEEGEGIRKIYDLRTTRQRSPLFSLSWTVIHPIDSGSPLYELTPGILEQRNAEVVVSVVGLDETFAQTIHARHPFKASEIIWGARFADVLRLRPNGDLEVDYAHIDDVIMVEDKSEPARISAD